MAWNIGWFLLALTIAQVVSGYVEVDYAENVIEKAVSRGSRIVSGWDALPGQHPHQVGLRMVNAAGGVSSCGGSVVHTDYVLTAAHCTAGQVYLILRAGVVFISDPNPAYLSESRVWYNHPTYNDFLPTVVQPNDISIVRLSQPVQYSALIKPIRIQPYVSAFSNYDQEQVYASGFGRTWTGGSTSDVLQWVYLTAVSNDECFRTFGSIITANTVCARSFNVTSQSICQGDSGGPLVHVGADGIPTLIGISSFVAGGDFGCHSGFPGGFIRPGPFLPWLKEITSIDFEAVEPPTTTEATTPTTESTTPITETTTPITETTTSTTTTQYTTPPPDNTTGTTVPLPETTTSLPETTTTQIPTTTESPSTTETPEPEEDSSDSKEDSSDSKEDSSDSKEDSSDSSSEEDPEIADLLKRLEVKVKVKVKVNDFKKKHVIHHKH